MKTANGWELIGNIKGADGQNGQPGQNGQNGQDGQNGESAYQIYLKYHSNYAGTEEEWINDLAAGNLNRRFTVTFNTGRGESVAAQEVEYRSVLHDVPLTPVRTGHYGHWEVNSELVDLSSYVITADTVVDAVYDSSDFAIDSAGYVYLYNGNKTEVVIPQYVMEKEVKGVFATFFTELEGKNITSITFPDSMTTLEAGALTSATKLETINFGAGIENLDSSMFEINIGKNVALQDINVDIHNPNYASIDGVLCNKERTKLIAYPIGRTNTSYLIPSIINTIGPRAFGCNRNLRTIVLNNVKTLETHALESCINLEEVISNSLEVVNDNAFAATKISSFTFPDTVTYIGEYGVFAQCEYLEEVILGSGCTQIYVSNFIGCSEFDVNSLGNQLCYHHQAAWEHDEGHEHHWHICTDSGYEDVKVDYGTCNYVEMNKEVSYEEDGYHIIACDVCGYEQEHEDFIRYDDRALDCLSHLTFELINGDTEYKITAFDNAIETLYIPRVYNDKPVTQIGYTASYNKDNLVNLYIPGTISYIGPQAFSNCDGLKNVYMFEGIETIDRWAFSACSSLENAIIPDSVTTFGNDIFENCDLLDYTVEGVFKYAQSRSNPHKILCENTDNTLDSYTINEECEIIESGMFFGNTNLEEIDIPASVKVINAQCFEHCSALTSVTLHRGLEVIGNASFAYCDLLAEFPTLPNTIKEIGGSVFAGDSLLTSLNVEENENGFVVYEGAIYKMLEGTRSEMVCFPAGKSNVSFKNYVYSLADGLFSGCYNLTQVIIPGSVKEVGSYLFENCTNLNHCDISINCPYISNDMFYNCTSLEQISIPECVTVIKSYAFSGCTSLHYISLSWPGIQTIESNAFRNTVLDYIFYGDTMDSWNAIQKQGGWNNNINIEGNGVVHCQDGDLTIK